MGKVVLVSVVLPVYNRGNTIDNAVESVLAQTFDNWELIIVDDCSTDNTSQILSSFNDSRISILKFEKNSGAATARNFGIRKCKGQYISFLDSDDVYEREFLALSVKKFGEVSENVGLIWTGVRYFRKKNNRLFQVESSWQPLKNDNPYFSFLSNLKIGTNSGITIRRAVFDKVGLFDEDLPAAEDTDLFLRITQHYAFDYINQCLINIHQVEGDRLSKRFDKIARAYNVIIPKHLGEIEKHRTLRLKYFYKAMWLNYHLNNKMLARRYFKRLCMDKFFYSKAWVIFLLFEVIKIKWAAKIHIWFSAIEK